jgi:hypothetical protein
MEPPSNHVAHLAEELFRRIGNAEHVVRTGDYTNDDFERRGRCHENVARWVDEHPRDRPVRGWLVDESQSLYGYIDFHAHSVVDTALGGLRDVTLGAIDPDFRFLRETLPDDKFLVLASAHPTLRHVVDHELYEAFNRAVEDACFCGRFDTQD